MPPAGSPVQYAGKPAAKPASKPAKVVTAKVPEPKKLAQQVAPMPSPAPAPARVSYAPPKPAPPPQGQRPLRDYNAAPQNHGQPTYQSSYQAPRPQPAQQAPRANQPLPKGYTPSIAAPGVRSQGPQSMDELLAGVK